MDVSCPLRKRALARRRRSPAVFPGCSRDRTGWKASRFCEPQGEPRRAFSQLELTHCAITGSVTSSAGLAMDWQTFVARRTKRDARSSDGWNAFLTVCAAVGAKGACAISGWRLQLVGVTSAMSGGGLLRLHLTERAALPRPRCERIRHIVCDDEMPCLSATTRCRANRTHHRRPIHRSSPGAQQSPRQATTAMSAGI
jgi:hypothetical protein